MKKLFRLKSIAFFLTTAMFITSCESDVTDIFDVPIDPSTVDGELSVFEDGGDNRNVTINGSSISGTLADVTIAFKSSSSTMRRLYVTQNVSGFGAEPYEFATGGITVSDKKDGSLDLPSDKGNEFEIQIPLPIPNSADSQIVYTIWATTGRGDFRDITKRNAIGDTAVGTITITGSGNSTANGVRTFSATMLAAPLGDGSSSTFISLFNSTVYRIDQGTEFASLWDFGYFYGATSEASLASADNYPSDIIDIAAVSNADAGETFNKAYFALSAQTSADFDAVSSSSDLDFITASANQRITGLNVGDIIEIVDNYGNKGMIRVANISGTDGTGDFIQIDIKIQI